MKIVLFILSLSTVFSGIKGGNSYIRYTSISNNKIEISTSDSTFEGSYDNKIYKIEHDSGKRYFYYENIKIFLDVDVSAKFEFDIKDFLKKNTSRPDPSHPAYLPYIYLVFILDSEGNILLNGLDHTLPTDNYQVEFFRLMKLIKGRLEPSLVDGKPVGSLFTCYIDYYEIV